MIRTSVAEPPPLAGGEVHVWLLGLDLPPARLEGLSRVLSADERQRAGRFHRARLRDRFVAARGQIREILAGYVRLPPAGVAFAYGAHGKPRLPDGAPRFNLSHSEGHALLAVSRNREVGVDIERILPGVDCEGIARRFFSAAEMAALMALPPSARRPAFFAAWTRKEAFVKAKGGGLAIPLAGFDVSLAPSAPARLLRTVWDPHEAARWWLDDLEAPAGFCAALAVEGRRPRLRVLAPDRPDPSPSERTRV